VTDGRTGPVDERVLKFVVPHEPVPKQLGVVMGRGRRVYKGARVAGFEMTVRTYCLRETMRCGWRAKNEERFAVELVVFVADLRRTDCDNLAKSILDGLKTVAFPDDSQVTDLLVRKRVDHEKPRVEITITRLSTYLQNQHETARKST
jgi:Holliday junction resolvase RusA-like endonuclease